MSVDTTRRPVALWQEPVGHLLFHKVSSWNDVLPAHPGQIVCSILPRMECDIGRETFQQAANFKDCSVSKHHVRVRCVMYEADEEQQVQPMISFQVLSTRQVLFQRCGALSTAKFPVKKGDDDTLLCDGDVIRLSSRTTVVFRTSRPYHPHGLHHQHSGRLQHDLRQFEDHFTVSSRLLGKGAFASVFFAFETRSGRQLACKIVPFDKDTPLHTTSAAETIDMKVRRAKLAREYNVLRGLSHPNIISLEKVIRSSSHIFIFQELVTGGDLLSYNERRGPLAEPEAAMITKQILEATDFLHSHNIVHRDIKPENILMTSWREGSRIILADFGAARRCSEAVERDEESAIRMHSMVGTHGYAAPEVYRTARCGNQQLSGYSKAVDIWSIGSLLPTLLTHDFVIPMRDSETRNEMSLSQLSMHLDILDTGEEWSTISHAAKSLIRGCLMVDEEARITAKEALAHEWFTQKAYCAEFEAAYKRAVQGWIPRKLCGQFVESIHGPKTIESPDQRRPASTSRHFALNLATPYQFGSLTIPPSADTVGSA